MSNDKGSLLLEPKVIPGVGVGSSGVESVLEEEGDLSWEEVALSTAVTSAEEAPKLTPLKVEGIFQAVVFLLSPVPPNCRLPKEEEEEEEEEAFSVALDPN